MDGMVLVKKEDARRAAWNAKRCVLKGRMDLLRKEALRSLNDGFVTKVFCSLFGIQRSPVTKKRLRDRMYEMWHYGSGLTEYRLSGWGVMGYALTIIDACKSCSDDTLYLDLSLASFISKWR